MILEKIDASVHSQGISIDSEAWLVLGSQAWNNTKDELKALAYQAARLEGWTDRSLSEAVRSKYQHVDADLMEFTLSELKDLLSKFGFENYSPTQIPN